MNFPSLSTVSDVASDLSAAMGFGAFKPVVLGGFGFMQFEVPEQIKFGSKILHSVHTRPGGQRQIDMLGVEPHNISWSGQFLGPDASQRAQELRSKIEQGIAVILTWGSFSAWVLVENLDLEYKRASWVCYSINCISLPPDPKAAPTGLLGSLSKKLGDALGIDVAGTLKGVNTALKQISPLLGAVSQLTGGSPFALKILSAVNSAQGITTGLGQSANGSIFGLASIATTFTGNSKVIGALGALGTAVNDAPKLLSIGNHLTVMSKNLSNVAAG